MSGNSFGKIFTITSFGESHGKAIGGIVDGCPPGIPMDVAFIQQELNRRRPGQNIFTTPRDEDDKVEILSGEFEGLTTGTPIGFLIKNKNHNSEDYSDIKNYYRPSHADYTYDQKYGYRDYRGGGRASARETVSRVVAGAIAKLMLRQHHVHIAAFTSRIGGVGMDTSSLPLLYSLKEIESSPTRCPDPDRAKQMEQLLRNIHAEGDSVGGIITCVIRGVKPGLGSPVFDKLHAVLGQAMLSINAVKGFEYGSGFEASKSTGSKQNDLFTTDSTGTITTKSNHSGGIQGGISNGEDIYFNVAFKPVPSIAKEQQTLNTTLEETKISIQGRHDPCVVPRAIPIVEAMAAIVIADAYLLDKTLR